MNLKSIDIVVLGGGIAGLFTLSYLLKAGYSAILVEKNKIGSGQTIKSQGIIHGGTKYNLLGRQTNAAKQISRMPSLWRDYLSGVGQVDLSDVKILSENQNMWAMNNVSSLVTGFFASNLMKSKVKKIRLNDTLEPFNNELFKGNLYELDEPVLDVYSLVSCMSNQMKDNIITNAEIDIINKEKIKIKKNEVDIEISCSMIVATAGGGNADISGVEQQLRPLHMSYIKVPKDYGKTFVHILKASDKPRLTISTYDYDDKYNIWYLGGDLAEKGVTMSNDELYIFAIKELSEIFPWLGFDNLDFSSFFINRAEIKSNGIRPDAPSVSVDNGVITAYPTKLVMAPVLAEMVLNKLEEVGVKKTGVNNLFIKNRFNADIEIENYPWFS